MNVCLNCGEEGKHFVPAIDGRGSYLCSADADGIDTTEIMQRIVAKFLAWPLPASVCSDLAATKQNTPHRSGTTLLTAIEATQMFEYVLADVFTMLRAQESTIAQMRARTEQNGQTVATQYAQFEVRIEKLERIVAGHYAMELPMLEALW